MSRHVHLRRTIRRCTAIVVAALGVTVGSLSTAGTLGPALVASGALLYLVGSAVFVPDWETPADSPEE